MYILLNPTSPIHKRMNNICTHHSLAHRNKWRNTEMSDKIQKPVTKMFSVKMNQYTNHIVSRAPVTNWTNVVSQNQSFLVFINIVFLTA
jgi:hypothetical protein